MKEETVNIVICADKNVAQAMHVTLYLLLEHGNMFQ